MKNISDYDYKRLSSFLDGELSRPEAVILLEEMEDRAELKDYIFSDGWN